MKKKIKKNLGMFSWLSRGWGVELIPQAAKCV